MLNGALIPSNVTVYGAPPVGKAFPEAVIATDVPPSVDPDAGERVIVGAESVNLTFAVIRDCSP
jgi:hypothetical protein